MGIEGGVSLGDIISLIGMAVGLVMAWFNLKGKVEITDANVTRMAKDVSAQFNEMRARVSNIEADVEQTFTSLQAVEKDFARMEEREKMRERMADTRPLSIQPP